LRLQEEVSGYQPTLSFFFKPDPNCCPFFHLLPRMVPALPHFVPTVVSPEKNQRFPFENKTFGRGPFGADNVLQELFSHAGKTTWMLQLCSLFFSLFCLGTRSTRLLCFDHRNSVPVAATDFCCVFFPRPVCRPFPLLFLWKFPHSVTPFSPLSVGVSLLFLEFSTTLPRPPAVFFFFFFFFTPALHFLAL